MTLGKRVGRLEVKNASAFQALAEDQRKKKVAAREQWRQDNHDIIGWNMFLSVYGPDSDWYTMQAEPDNPDLGPEMVAQIAYSEKFREILKQYSGCLVDYSRFEGFDAGFAFAIEMFYGAIGDFNLLRSYLHCYGVDLPCNTPLIDLARKKIEESGLEWMQIAYSDKMQRSLEESLFGEFLSENFMMY